MPFQALTIDLNANLSKLAADFDKVQQLSDQAAARIANSANKAGAAVGEAANQADFDDLSQSAKDAAASIDAMRGATIGTGTAADQAKSKLGALFEDIDKKAGQAYDTVTSKGKVVGIAISAGVGILLAGTVAGAIYAATKAVEALGSAVDEYVITGEGYKSKNIDALDAQDQKVRQLQVDLITTAQAASALDLAFKQTGVPKDDYTAVYKATEIAIRKAIDAQNELQGKLSDARQTGDSDKITAAEKAVDGYSNAFKELGIQYQDANGKALSTTAVIQSSAKALGDYAQGYDRNAAAAALAIGDYAKVANAAKITADTFGAAQDRQKAYLLVIGPNTQAALDEYHKAVAGFQTESDLMSQGFKAAIADAILPQLTGLADYFKDGFPSAVSVFREILTAGVAALEFFKIGVFTVSEPVIASFEAIGIGAAAGMQAAQKALHLDFSGAVRDVDEGRQAILDRFASLPDAIRARIELSERAINLARGSDSLDANAKLGDRPIDVGAGRAFTKRTGPGDDDKATTKSLTPNVDVAKKRLEEQLKALDVYISKERDLLTTLDDFLTTNYQRSEISLGDYFDALAVERDANLKRTQDAYAKEIAATNAYIAATQANGDLSQDQKDARIVEGKTKLIDIEGKLAKAEFDSAVAAKKAGDSRKDALQSYRDGLASVVAQIEAFSGNSAKAFTITFDIQNRDKLKQYAAVQNSSNSSQDDRNEALQGAADLLRLREQGLATARLNDLSSARSVIMGDLANQQARFDLAVANGQKTELQGLADLSAANKARIPLLEQIVQAYEAVAASSSNAQDKLNAETARVELEKLKSQTDLVADAFNQAGRDVTTNFFDKLADRSTSLHDKLRALFDDITSRIAKQGDAVIANWLFGKDSGVFSGFGAQIQNWFSPSGGAGSLSGSATAAASGASSSGLLGTAGSNAALTTFTTTVTAANPPLVTLSSAATAAAAALAQFAGKSAVNDASDVGDFAQAFELFSAKGNAFSGGNVLPFASGGVVDRPTIFPMRSGRLGLMGEAGPEAIMPLRRGRDGNLGIVNHGGSGGATYITNNHINVPAPTNRDLSTPRQHGEAIRRALR